MGPLCVSAALRENAPTTSGFVKRKVAKPLRLIKEKRGAERLPFADHLLSSQLEDELQRKLNVPSAEPRALYEFVR
jgi:hypothetical protein